MTAIGYVLMVIAIGYLVYKLYLSYNSAGGTDMMVSVNDGAMFPPIIFVVGLYCLQSSRETEWSIWLYLGLWLAVTIVSAIAIRLVQELGDRPL